MPTVLGADGCPGNGWVVAEVSGGVLRWHHVVGARALAGLAERLGAMAVAVDVPIGLPDAGLRACDVQARALLKGGGASSVFAAPTRPALAERTYAAARAAVPSLSAQSFALAERIRDVDEHVAMDDRFVECHPEGAFRLLTGRVLPRKKSASGALARLAALEAVFGRLPPEAPPAAALDDALDAAACAWTAGRWLCGEALLLGDGTKDRLGRPMRVVV